MRLSAFKKLNFGVHGVQEMFFRHAKNSIDRLNFKKKVIDNNPKKILRTKSLVRPPDDNINQPNSD